MYLQDNRIVYSHTLSRKWLRRLRVQGQRNCVLLQGPVGPFFGDFRKALAAAGINAIKINFNGGDWLFARGECVINFRGGAEAWGGWFRELIDLAQPEFIMLMGDERPLHAIAIAIAREQGVPVWVLEEGYIRPNYITCELFGVNANSPLKSDWSKDLAAPAAAADDVRFRNNGFSAMAAYAVAYYWGLTLGRPFFPRFTHHRNRSLIAEAFLWTRNAWRKARRYRANNKLLMDLLEHHDKAFFIVALQVSDDLQLVAHGKGWTVERLITAAIKSFALYADPADILVFKGHPMDRGHFPYASLISEMARLADVADRVRFIDDGSIGLMIRHAKGLIVVNSTSGLSALHHGTPLLCLGETFYNKPELVSGDGSARALDAFWRTPRAPDPQAAKKMLAAIRAQALINGNFYLRPGFDITFRNILSRLESSRVEVEKESDQIIQTESLTSDLLEPFQGPRRKKQA